MDMNYRGRMWEGRCVQDGVEWRGEMEQLYTNILDNLDKIDELL